MKTSDLRGKNIFGVISVIMTPLAIFLAVITYVILENVPEKSINTSMRTHLPEFTRVFVLTTIVLIGTGIVSGLIALIKNDRPRWLPIVGLSITLLTIILFHFIAIGPNGD
jgi:heme/copper-type cytochrome/quinol oxidase subunit 3